MNIIVKLEVSQNNSTEKLDVEQDMGIPEEIWINLSDEEKKQKIQDYIFDMPEQPYWVLDMFNEED